VPSVDVANKSQTVSRTESRSATRPTPASEYGRYEPRFRVVKRRSLVTPRRKPTGSPLQRALLLGAFPALCLLVYVFFWTLTMRGAYYRAELQHQIQEIKLEQAELEAAKRELQSPALIFARATKELGMQPPAQREFARLPVPQHMARAGLER
jgi:hypothetical protein